MLIAGGYEEGAYEALRRMARKLSFYDAHLYAIENGPTYHEIRWFLEGDCDVDPRTAQRVAFEILARRNRLRRSYQGEVGWI